MLSRIHRVVFSLTGLAVAAAAWAAPPSSVNLPLRGRDRVLGTVRPAADLELFLCDVPSGAALSVSVKGKSRGGPPFVLELFDFGGNPVPGATFVTRGTGQSLTQPFAVPASSRYTVRVSGDGEHDGDYELKVAWKPKTAWSSGGLLDTGVFTSFNFAAPAGANATIDVRPAAHSAFAGEIVGVDGPAGPVTVPPGTTSHLALQRLPATGDYIVTFRNAAATAGNWTAKATIKPPRLAAASTDIRDSRLSGAFAGDHTVYGTVVGPTGGTLEVTATYGPLDGTSVSVPSGTLSGPTILTVSAAPPLALGDGNHAAGPAIDLGPSGTVFDPTGTDLAHQATVTIPFDPAYFPSGTDSLVIFVRSSTGVVTEVPRPYQFGVNTVSFAASHFSSYQAATAGPRALSGDFLVLEADGDQSSNYQGQFRIGIQRLTTSANGAALSFDDVKIPWQDLGPQLGSFAQLNQNFNEQALQVTVEDDQHVSVVDPNDPKAVPTKFRRGASDDVLVAVSQSVVLLRRAAGSPTVATVAGKWHVFHVGFETRNSGSQPPIVNLGIEGNAGTLTLGADGTVSFSGLKTGSANTDFPAGAWTVEDNNGTPSGITWDILDGSVRLLIPDLNFPVNMTAVLDGDVLVGRGASPNGDGAADSGPWAELFVLVRASSSATLAQAAGDYFTIGCEFDTVNGKTGTGGQGFNFNVPTLTATLTKTGSLSAAGVIDIASHDGQGDPFFVTNQPANGVAGKLTLRPDGFFSVADGAHGAISRGGELLVRLVADGQLFSIELGTPLVLKPRKADLR